jgi:hypothetical protein
MPSDLLWTIASFLLTLMIFSYILGDNILFRLASYLFVGVASGYVATLVFYQVILPRLFWPLLNGAWLQVSVPLVLSLLLVAKLFPRISTLGNISMAYTVGVAAAVIIGGAVIGTLFSQAKASINMFGIQAAGNSTQDPLIQFLGSGFILIGTLSTLIYFNFGAVAKPNQPPHRTPIIELLARIGQIFIAITLGALFAGIFAASITALIERLDFIKNTITLLIS